MKQCFRFVGAILGRIFLPRGDSQGLVPLGQPRKSIRYLRRLGRVRREEGRVACDLGALAVAVHRQGLEKYARALAKGAFRHWCRERTFSRRLRGIAEAAVREHAL